MTTKDLITIIIALYASLLSSYLAYIRWRERKEERFRLIVKFAINPNGPDENEIRITNRYKNPITIDGFELYWAKRKNASQILSVRTSLEQSCLIQIEAHETRVLVFNEEDHFVIRQGQGKLFLRLHIAGRKSVTQMIFPFVR
ncbi:hypothetical protein SAMN05428975_0417 [Mucilaginibacter sp. OK268]|uniref:hypothetical protein n=1 Tax=Mucilaginibacter sp. OK268 TaxID=1881048 RepID=UPI000882544C|nr:hypothetical protein [Mucilaginibacter sp. OK268]SDP13031.1 hypothetical protein SAMN05428975_0417 [Mucilaginibacter sp. OK268]